MIVRTLKQIQESNNEIVSDGWTSRRYLLKKDGMGFSFHETIIDKGAKLNMWYKNHLEAVYCISGKGTITDIVKKEKHEIIPGTMYALNNHDKHILEAETEIRVMCVFNPPCSGNEKHDKDGSYPLL